MRSEALLWPMSRGTLPKQLIPFVDGKSLLQIAVERQEGLLPEELAREHHAVVVDRHDDVYVVAMENPGDEELVGVLGDALGGPVETAIAVRSEL